MYLRMATAGVAGLGMLGGVLLARAEPPQGDVVPKGKDAPPVVQKKPGAAVIELFTSEGCSSCPPADELAATLAREAKEKGDDVFVIAMHVDYWNYLGWKDPFAQAQFTRRQRAYATAIGKSGGNSGVFTPEMVVNGSVGFTGSDAATARREIDHALALSGRLKLETAMAERAAGDPVRVHTRVKGDSRWTMVSVAIVEDGLSSVVTAGENAKKTLTHDRVARAFVQAPVKNDEADVELKLPAGVDEAKCHVVVYAQDEKSMRVLAATQLPLKGPETAAPPAVAGAPKPGVQAPAK